MLRVSPAMEGKQGKCPKCNQLTLIRTALAAAPPPSNAVAMNGSEPSARQPSPPPFGATTAAPKASSLADKPIAERGALILGAFGPPIQPVTRPRTYFLGLAGSTLVMVILPLLYVLFVAGIVSLIIAHAVYDVWIFDANLPRRGGIWLVLAYVGPIVAGSLVVVFMLKPIFARFPVKQATRSLTREQEPLLFAFVDKVCDTVHAPRPRRIDVDCDVNASASFRRGVWSFFGNDLVLTIGLPLTAGLSLQEFGGVLAHEFGHFSQGAGMRLSYIVRSISHWFARVVHERDNWDLWLEQNARGTDLRIGVFLYLAMGGVWLSRKVLSVLMYSGFFVVSYLMREMEFDADKSEARFAGSDSFASTMRKLPVLGLAFHGAIGDAYRAYQEDRLADNLPKLMLHRHQQIPADVIKQFTEKLEEEKTGRFDTHPSNRDRIEATRKENAPGVFRMTEPASVLFQDFDAICRLSTCDYYTDVVGLTIRPGVLHPVEGMLKDQEAEAETEKALSRLVGSAEPFRKLETPALLTNVNLEESIAYLHQVREYIRQHRADYFATRLQFGVGRTSQIEGHSRHTLIRAGMKFKGDGPRDLASSAAKAREDAALQQTTAELLIVYENCMGQRLSTALSILASGHFGQTEQAFSRAAPHLKHWMESKRLLDSLSGQRDQLELAMIAFVSLLPHLEVNSNNAGYVDSVVQASKEVLGIVNDIARRTLEAPYPLDHRDTSMTIGKFLRPKTLLTPEQIGESYEMGSQVLERFDDLNRRLTARLALMAEQIELALGIPPLADPPVAEEVADGQLKAPAS